MIEEPCPTCAGQGRLRELKKYRVNIPAGVKEGSRIRLPGKGEAGLRGGPAGDLYVVTHVERVAGVPAQGRELRGRGADHGRRGAPGRGRALGVGEMKLSSMIVPSVKKLTYHVHLKRVILRKLVLGIADGVLHADGNLAYEANDLRVGLFKDATAPVSAAAGA